MSSQMDPKAITFDCAGTLLDVRWRPDAAVRACGVQLGIEVTPAMGDRFAARFTASRQEYESVNRTRDVGALRAFWLDLHAAWLNEVGLSRERAESFVRAAEALTYDRAGGWFVPFPDVLAALRRLRIAGFRMAVVSNWDCTLHRILEAHKLHRMFDVVLASLEEGIEKPDPAIYAVAVERLGVSPGEIVHIGDDPLDDLQGARRAGLRALLLDRSPGALAQRDAGVIRNLDELPEALAWSA